MLSYKKSSIFMSSIARSVAVLLLTCGLGHQARAVDLTFTAEFRPNAANPTHNKFVNTTPQSGFCVKYPNLCGSGFSVGTEISVAYGNMDVLGAPRSAAYFAIPGVFRNVVVANEQGENATLKWRADSLSGSYVLPVPATELAPDAGNVFQAHDAIWEGRAWVYTPRPCIGGSGVHIGSATHYRFRWDKPETADACVKIPRVAIPGPMRIADFSIGYILETPDPLSMKNGVYRGDLTLTVGPGGDFDFGDRSTASDSVVNLHFELTVQHEFRVEFPPGSDHAVLVPEGGWNSWVDHGRLPTRLSRDLPFSLTSSVPISVTLQCQYPQPGGDCGLRNTTTPTAPEVPVEVALTMPGFREIVSKADALNLKLSEQGSAARFSSDAYAANRASRLHFDVKGEHVKGILDHPGSQYRGNVTLVFDAQP